MFKRWLLVFMILWVGSFVSGGLMAQENVNRVTAKVGSGLSLDEAVEPDEGAGRAVPIGLRTGWRLRPGGSRRRRFRHQLLGLRHNEQPLQSPLELGKYSLPCFFIVQAVGREAFGLIQGSTAVVGIKHISIVSLGIKTEQPEVAQTFVSGHLSPRTDPADTRPER